jgi:exopolysaccharide biosynthesis protein
MHIVEIDLAAPGIGFKLTSPGGPLETVRQTTLDFLNQEHAQVAINGHFFLPFPSRDPNAALIGLAASNGNVYSAFEAPVQSYAIVTNAPAINIDPSNHADIVHIDARFEDGKHVRENATLWNALSGSAQIITNGVKTIPEYAGPQRSEGLLTPGGPAAYSNTNSWYNLSNARTSIGLSKDKRTLVLFTADKAGGSLGMNLGEVADLLLSDYGVYNALNLDGGGSTTMAMQDSMTRVGRIVNVSSDNPGGRAVGSNLAVFATASSGVSYPRKSNRLVRGTLARAENAASRLNLVSLRSIAAATASASRMELRLPVRRKPIVFAAAIPSSTSF